MTSCAVIAMPSRRRQRCASSQLNTPRAVILRSIACRGIQLVSHPSHQPYLCAYALAGDVQGGRSAFSVDSIGSYLTGAVRLVGLFFHTLVSEDATNDYLASSRRSDVHGSSRRPGGAGLGGGGGGGGRGAVGLSDLNRGSGSHGECTANVQQI